MGEVSFGMFPAETEARIPREEDHEDDKANDCHNELPKIGNSRPKQENARNRIKDNHRQDEDVANYPFALRGRPNLT